MVNCRLTNVTIATDCLSFMAVQRAKCWCYSLQLLLTFKRAVKFDVSRYKTVIIAPFKTCPRPAFLGPTTDGTRGNHIHVKCVRSETSPVSIIMSARFTHWVKILAIKADDIVYDSRCCEWHVCQKRPIKTQLK